MKSVPGARTIRRDDRLGLRRRDIRLLAGGATLTIPGKFLGRGIQFGSQVLLARVLGPQQFGLYAIGWALMSLTASVAPLGFQHGVIRFAYLHRRVTELRAVLVSSIGIAVVSGTAAGAAFFVTASWLANQVFGSSQLVGVIRWFSVGFPLIVGLRVAAAATRTSQRMEYAVVAEDLVQPSAFLTLLVIVFYAFRGGLLEASMATTLAYGAGFGLALHYLKKLHPLIFVFPVRVSGILRPLLRFSLPTGAIAAFATGIAWTDRLILGYYGLPGDVGVYQATAQVTLAFVLILGGLQSILVPLVADLHVKQDVARLEELYRVSTKWGLYLSMPFFLLIVFYPREILSLLYGGSYAGGATALLILSAGQLINLGTGSVGFLLIMTGKERVFLAISGCMFIVNLILNLLLVPRFGIWGAAAATATASSLMYGIALLYVRRVLDLWPYDSRYWKGATAVGTTALILLVIPLLRLPSALELAVSLLLTPCAFATVLVALGADEEEKHLRSIVKGRHWRT